jgi:hypothetical protein
MIWEILAFIEQRYHETSLLPTKEILCERFSITPRQLAAYMRRKEFQTAFEARGLPSYRTIAVNDKGLLTPIQLAVANTLLNTHDRNTLRKKLQLLNVTTTQFAAWQKQPAFQDYLRSESIARFNNTDVDARLSLTKLVQDADLNAIKYYMEVSGIYNPVATQVIDLQRILASVLELLVRYLAPGELLEVANDLEKILAGSIPDPIEPKWIELEEPDDGNGIDGTDTIGFDTDVPNHEYLDGSERDPAAERQGLRLTLSRVRV